MFRSFKPHGFRNLFLSSCRRSSDRTFRLCNVIDLAPAQRFADRLTSAHFSIFTITADVRPRNIESQVILDLSHEQGYRRGHIPGALNLPLEKFDFTRPIDVYGGMTQEEVVDTFRSLGISDNTSEVILYDNSGLLACRLWFVLRYYGFTNVRILNGGWRNWLKAGLPVSEENHEPNEPLNLDLKPKRINILTKPSQMMIDTQNKTSQLIDSRRPEQFNAYHIPNSINIPSEVFMDDAKWVPPTEIKKVLEEMHVDVNKRTIVFSSQGLTSSVALFGLQMCGVDTVSLFDGGIETYRALMDDRLSMNATEHLQR